MLRANRIHISLYYTSILITVKKQRRRRELNLLHGIHYGFRMKRFGIDTVDESGCVSDYTAK